MTEIDGAGRDPADRSRTDGNTALRWALTALSFAAYAAAVLLLDQPRTVAFVNEEIGPIPAAVSRWLYGTPGGLVDTGVLDYFRMARTMETPAGEAVRRAIDGAMPPTGEATVAADGQGVGDIIAVNLAFGLFGPTAWALPLLYLLLIALSTACFSARYRDERMSAAPIMLLALTLLLLTRLVSDYRLAQEAPIGGIRYYAVVGILPALHWCFEFSGERDRARRGDHLRGALLGLQSLILMLAVFVRGSPVYLLLPIVASVGLALRRGALGWRKIASGLSVCGAAVVLCLYVLPSLAFPDYAASGRLYVEVWHKFFIGLGTSPKWPFPGVHETYSCPPIPEGIVPRVADRNGQCVWFSYTERQGVPEKVANSELYSGHYEKIVRDAFFDVLRADPYNAMEDFVYYKPRGIVAAVARTLPSILVLPASGPARWMLLLVELQLLLLVGFIAARPPPAPLRDAGLRLWVLLPFLIAVLIPLMATWAVEHTILDLMVFLLCGLLIGYWLVVSWCVNFAMQANTHLQEGLRLAEVRWPPRVTDRARGRAKTGTKRRPTAAR